MAASSPIVKASPSPSPWPALIGFLALALLVVGSGALSFRSAATYLEEERGIELRSVATLKAAQVARWRIERLTDARLLAGDSLVGRGLREGAAVAAEAKAELGKWLPTLQSSDAYVGITIVDRSGAIRLSVGEPAPPAMVLPLLASTPGEGAASDIERVGEGLRIAFVVPIAGAAGPSPGAVVLLVDPRPRLFPVVVSWHRPSRTGRGLLIGTRDGLPMVYTPVDGRRAPMRVTNAQGPSARAIRGDFDPARSTDYLGQETIAAAAPIPGSPWVVVAREDAADVLAALAERRSWTLSATLGLVLLAAIGSFAGWRVQVSRAEQARLRAALEREAMSRRLDQLTRFANDMVFLADGDQRIVEANERAEQLLGYTRDELIGLPVAALRHPSSLPDYEERVREQVARGTARFETTYQRKDGAPLPVEVSIHTDVVDGRRYFHGIARDIGERKRLEAQLLLSARMASVGTLAAGVAHEVNNPLSFILSNVDFALHALRAAGADAELLRALQDARDGSIRVREIVRGLQSFTRAEDTVETIDLRAIVRSIAELAAGEVRGRARLVVDAAEVPPVRAGASGLGQAILALLVNAAESIPPGRSAEAVVRVATRPAPGGGAIVEVQDTGVGIPADLLPRIFDPFFTTRPVGTGTGLGLSICHGIVTRAGGTIAVESEVGRGSTFRISLPAAGGPDDASPPPAPVARAVRERARILLIDDEPLVGTAVARILSELHDVTLRTDAAVALEELLGGAGFDLILCDLMMPGMSGMALHARLTQVAPALAARMLFLTGGACSAEAEAYLESAGIEPLQKPFDPAQLRARVAEALAAVAGVGA